MKLPSVLVCNWRELAIIAAILLSSGVFAACRDKSAAKDQTDEAPLEERPDEALSQLMKYISDGNAPGFAAICSYPIMRPYPLKDIEDSLAMVDYFPVIADDSLRDIMRKASLDDWESYGWRGWSVGEDTPIWFDEGVQAITYMSPAEDGLRRILAREEILSLAPRFREGWSPVMTLVSIEGDGLYRIDSKDGIVRLMGFGSPEKAHGEPDVLMTGSVSSEGSAGSSIYVFSDSIGAEAQFMPDAEPPARIFFKRQAAGEYPIEVRSAYWRDVVK